MPDARGQSASLRAIASNQKGQSAKGFLKRRKEGALHCRRLIPRNEAVAERERLGRTERGKGDDQEWEEEERTLRLNGGPTEERASGRCLEQSWLMRALQLAAPHNGIKEGGQRWVLPPLSLSDHPAIVGGQRLNGRVGS